MRPTDLGFRSPKDRTPAGYYPTITFDGRSLSVTPKRQAATIPQSKRFGHYDQDARKTGFRIGPGLYNIDILDISKGRIAGTPVIRENHGNKDFASNGYYFAGNHIVFDPYFVSKTKAENADRSALVEMSLAVSERSHSRPTTATSKRQDEEPVPWFLRTYNSTPLKSHTSKTPSKLERSGSAKKAVKSPYLASCLRARVDKPLDLD